jgi:CAAX protease family protein
MKTYHRLFLFLLVSLIVTVVISPWIAVAWDRFAAARPSLEPYRYSFSRIFDRCFLVTSILLFFPFRRFLKIGSAAQIGLAPRNRAGRDIAIGFACAVGSMAVLLALMAIGDLYRFYFRLPFGESIGRILSALLSGFAVAFLEEIFFRGIFFKEILQQGKIVRAFLVANLLYSAVHFVRPESGFRLDGYNPLGGLRYLVLSFQPFLDLPEVLPGLIGLFCIGVVLSYAVLRTDTLFLSMGLHAGWVFSIKTVRVFGDYTGNDLGWLFGSTPPKIVSGVIPWLGILTVGLLIHIVTRNRAAPPASRRLESEPSYGRKVSKLANR